jgi:hypothetical protein
MESSGTSTRWILARVLAAVAVSDIAYRLLVREPVRRSLGMQTRSA